MKKKIEKIKLTKPEKILLVLYELSSGKQKNFKFEDIVIKTFEKYPDDFHLRGYIKYPDSEAVGKEIYRASLKRGGLLNYGNKNFSLTKKGFNVAENIKRLIGGKSVTTKEKLSRYAEEEILRIIKLEGFQIFLRGDESKITDSDFYNYLGVSAKTQKNDFLGRLKTVTDAIKELKQIKSIDPLRARISEYQDFLNNKFTSIIEFKTK